MVNGCSMCKREVETCNHLLLFFPAAQEIWTMIFSLLGVNWVMAGSVREELSAWERLRKKKKVTRLIPLIVWWIVWKKRNRRVFERVESDKKKKLEIDGSTCLGLYY